MATTRRQFIKRSAGAVTVSRFMPQFLRLGTMAQETTGDRKLVKIFLMGGNDGLNTVVPYTNSRYYTLRPVIGLKESDLRDPQGRSTIISDRFGLHPALASLKTLYDEGKVAIVNGVGSTQSNLSHFDMMRQWHTGDPYDRKRDGWLGRYLNLRVGGEEAGIKAVSLKSFPPPQTFKSALDTPTISDFDDYGLRADPIYPNEQYEVLKVLEGAYARASANSGFSGEFSRVGGKTLSTLQKIRSIPNTYTSTVVYPANSPLADALKMVVQAMIALPEAGFFYVQTSGFDTHARQANPDSRATGTHANLLAQYSNAVAAYHADLREHSLADRVLTMTVSEFGRQVKQNGSNGTDHGKSGPVFLMSDSLRGGIYGEHPSLEANELDAASNMAVTVDFRAVYSNILERWLKTDPEPIVDQRFENLGFLD